MKQFLIVQQDYDYVYPEIKTDQELKDIPSQMWEWQLRYMHEQAPYNIYIFNRFIDGKWIPMTEQEKTDKISDFEKQTFARWNPIIPFAENAEIGDYISEPQTIVRIKDKN
jgi:hypothetical protein